MKIVGIVLILAGIMCMAGSGGDCDGDCPELANSMSEMIALIGVGAASMFAGLFLVKS